MGLKRFNCVHRGKELRKELCIMETWVKTYACALHGECILRKSAGFTTRNCLACKTFEEKR